MHKAVPRYCVDSNDISNLGDPRNCLSKYKQLAHVRQRKQYEPTRPNLAEEKGWKKKNN